MTEAKFRLLVLRALLHLLWRLYHRMDEKEARVLIEDMRAGVREMAEGVHG